MSILRASLFALALFAPGAVLAQSPPGPSSPPNPSFNLVNRGQTAIREFFATPAGRPNWGRDRLDGKGLAPGSKAAIRLPADGNCIYDLRAAFSDGRQEDRRGLNVCEAEDVPFGEAATTAQAAKSFRLINRGSAPITELAARVQGGEKWVTNRLQAGPIPPGGERALSLPPGGQCVFDLRVTFEGGASREKRAADLCKSPLQAVQ